MRHCRRARREQQALHEPPPCHGQRRDASQLSAIWHHAARYALATTYSTLTFLHAHRTRSAGCATATLAIAPTLTRTSTMLLGMRRTGGRAVTTVLIASGAITATARSSIAAGACLGQLAIARPVAPRLRRIAIAIARLAVSGLAVAGRTTIAGRMALTIARAAGAAVAVAATFALCFAMTFATAFTVAVAAIVWASLMTIVRPGARALTIALATSVAAITLAGARWAMITFTTRRAATFGSFATRGAITMAGGTVATLGTCAIAIAGRTVLPRTTLGPA